MFRHDRLIPPVRRCQVEGGAALAQVLHRPFTVDFGNDDVAGSRRMGALDNHQVAGLDAGLDHGIAFDLEQVACLRILDEILIEAHGVNQLFLGR
jgi:hypothetical protein